MTALKEALGEVGDQLVQAVALGLGLGREAIRSLTVDGWHRLQTVHYPERSPANAGRAGLSSHTDNGMLVLVAQDTVGGLFIRPPVAGEHRPCNWLPAESTSGLFEEVGPWHRVETKPGTLVCFPGMYRFKS
jgi:isopenicillin N synthase-like dioxygenase